VLTCFVIHFPGPNEDNALLMIANAGTHQIWTYFLKDATWLKKRFVSVLF